MGMEDKRLLYAWVTSQPVTSMRGIVKVHPDKLSVSVCVVCAMLKRVHVQCLEALCHIFSTTDFEAQRLALRCMWLLLVQHSHQVCSSFVAPLRGHASTSWQVLGPLPPRAADFDCPECRQASDDFAALVGAACRSA